MATPKLQGWQRIWMVFSMIWIVMVAAIKLPELPDDGPAYERARSEIDATFHHFEQSIAQPGSMTIPVQPDRYRYSDIAGYSSRPVPEFVRFVLADQGQRMIQLLCASSAGCKTSPGFRDRELGDIRERLNHQLYESDAMGNEIVKSTLLIALLPPLLMLMLGIGLVRMLAAKSDSNENSDQ